MTEISASLLLCVNPFLCHSREGRERSDRQVKPWPDPSERTIHAETGRRGGIALRTLRPLREIFWFTQSAQRSQRVNISAARRSRFLHVSAPLRLRGNDKMGWGCDVKPLPFRGGVGVGAVSHALRFPTAPTQRSFWPSPGDRAAAPPSPKGEEGR